MEFWFNNAASPVAYFFLNGFVIVIKANAGKWTCEHLFCTKKKTSVKYDLVTFKLVFLISELSKQLSITLQITSDWFSKWSCHSLLSTKMKLNADYFSFHVYIEKNKQLKLTLMYWWASCNFFDILSNLLFIQWDTKLGELNYITNWG